MNWASVTMNAGSYARLCWSNRMRVILALALSLCSTALASAFAQEAAPELRAGVIEACVQDFNVPVGVTISRGAIQSYCQCATDETAAVFTAREFDIFARYGMSRAGMGPSPTAAEIAPFDTAEFRTKSHFLRARVETNCRPLLGVVPQ